MLLQLIDILIITKYAQILLTIYCLFGFNHRSMVMKGAPFQPRNAVQVEHISNHNLNYPQSPKSIGNEHNLHVRCIEKEEKTK
jgi:hypothetical protein